MVSFNIFIAVGDKDMNKRDQNEGRCNQFRKYV